MKQQRPKTTEQLIQEVFFSLIIFIALALAGHQLWRVKQAEKQQPSIEDLHQQQEMIDYHRAQGRNVILD